MKINNIISEGDVVAFPKKHKGDLDSVNDCPKCGGDLQGGKYMGHAVKVCMPCKQVYLPPNSGIDQQGNTIKEEGATSHAELAKLAHDAYVQATRKGNGPMAAHYLKQYEKHKANLAKTKKQGVAEGYDSEELANEVYAEFERIYPNLARRADERTIHAAIMDVLNYGGDNDAGALAQDVARAVKQQMSQGVAEGNPSKPDQPEADYGDDYQAMVSRVKKLAGMGPLQTVYDPQKRVYRNVPTATQPKK